MGQGVAQSILMRHGASLMAQLLDIGAGPWPVTPHRLDGTSFGDFPGSLSWYGVEWACPPTHGGVKPCVPTPVSVFSIGSGCALVPISRN